MNRLSRLSLPAFCALAMPAWAQTSAVSAPHAHTAAGPVFEISGVLNPSWQSSAQALSHRDRGLGLGHSDVNLDLNLTSWLKGRLSAVAHSDHHKIEAEAEEAYLEAPALPGGMQLRAGRFLSQLGYLNELHPHADDFVMRPALHRAFLGGHYFDNGVRLNWVAPTSFYWRLGAEVMQGKRLPTLASSSATGAWTLGTRLGNDLGNTASWQLGVSTLRHRAGALGAAGEVHHEHELEPGAEHTAEAATDAAHAHSHGAVFFGRRMDVIEAVWKWAPNGNSRARQLRLSAEFARVGDIGEAADSGLRHSAWYLSAVYRFLPQWEIGVRLDTLNALARHEEGFEAARLQERSLSLAWKPDHMTAVRLQFTTQRDRGGFTAASEIKPSNAVHLQVVRSFGAHGAHAY